MQVRFRAQDLGTGQIIEAGVDVFRAEVFQCDYCQPDYPLQTVGPATLSMCGGDLSPGTSTELAVENMPAGTNGLLVLDAVAAPWPWNGGELITPAPVVLGPIFADAAGEFRAPLAIGGLLPPGWGALRAGGLQRRGAAVPGRRDQRAPGDLELTAGAARAADTQS